MVIRHGETEASRYLETSTGCEHHDRRGFKRVLLWEYEFTPVEAACVGRVGGSFNDVVPFKEVVFNGCRVDVWVRHGIFLD